MSKGHSLFGPAFALPSHAQHATALRFRERFQFPGIEDQHSTGPRKFHFSQSHCSFDLGILVQLRGLLAQAVQHFGDPGIETIQHWQQLMADAVAGETQIEVGGIFAMGLVDGMEEFAEFIAADTEEGADYCRAGLRQRPEFLLLRLRALTQPGSPGIDPTQPLNSGAADQAVQHRFGLVVEGVSRGDPSGIRFRGHLHEKSVPRFASFTFEVTARHRDAFGSHFEIPSLGQSNHECFIGIGFATAELMIDVGDDEFSVPLTPSPSAAEGEGSQKSQQCHRIGTSRDGHDTGYAAPLRGEAIHLQCDSPREFHVPPIAEAHRLSRLAECRNRRPAEMVYCFNPDTIAVDVTHPGRQQ